MNDKFTTWLDGELKYRGWSDRELGRRAGLTGAAISAAKSGVRKPGWDLCAAVAKALGKPPLEIFRLAGLLPEESHGENEPALLHLYRKLQPGYQQAALAMLHGLAGQQAPVTAPAPGADVDAVCKLLARLGPVRLEVVSIFVRWLVDQPPPADTPGKPTWEDVVSVLASLSPEKRENILTNLIRRYGLAGKNPDALENNHSESNPEHRRGPNQGTLF